jgi:hypothetical protein
MGAILKAAVAYFSIVFAIGFAMGIVRVVVTAPVLGETWATIGELPVMLAASWIACKRVMERWKIPPTATARLATGGLAFAFLIGAEFALGAAALGRTLPQMFASYRQTGPLLGLIAQILFGLLPQIQAARTAGRCN